MWYGYMWSGYMWYGYMWSGYMWYGTCGVGTCGMGTCGMVHVCRFLIPYLPTQLISVNNLLVWLEGTSPSPIKAYQVSVHRHVQ